MRNKSGWIKRAADRKGQNRPTTISSAARARAIAARRRFALPICAALSTDRVVRACAGFECGDASARFAATAGGNPEFLAPAREIFLAKPLARTTACGKPRFAEAFARTGAPGNFSRQPASGCG